MSRHLPSLRSWSLTAALLAACATSPAPTQPSPGPREAAEQQVVLQMVTALMTQQAQELARQHAMPSVSDAALAELSARLAALTARLDHLDRGGAPAAPVAADATAVRAGLSPAMQAGIEALRSAIDVIDQQRAVSVENLGNVSTAGYKKRQVVTTTTLDAATGLQLPHVQRIEPVLTMGALHMTDRNLDLAIDGDGWFVATAEDGTRRFTRAGRLQVDAEGRLVLPSGRPLSPAIVIPNDTLEIGIDPEGRVVVRTASEPDAAPCIGRLQLARCVNPSALVAVGDHEFAAPPASGEVAFGSPCAPGFGAVKQGFLEGSNVQIVNELVNLQVAARQRSACVRALADFGVYVR